MKIGYLTVPSGKLADQPKQYGLNVVINAAVTAGYSPEAVTPSDDLRVFDVLLVGLYWWEHILNLVRLVKSSGIKPKQRKPIIVIGGQNAALNPLPVASIIDYAVAVDGEVVIGDLLDAISRGETEPNIPGVWWPGKGEPSDAVSSERLIYFPHVQFQGKLTTDGEDALKTVTPVSFIEIARGCPHHCRFCALSSLKPYRELPYPEVERAIAKARTKQMRVFAPERSAHSRFSDIEACCRANKKINVSVDIRLESISKLAAVGGVQFGLEGLSERLRCAVGKRISNEDFARYMGEIYTTPTYHRPNHMGCNAYLIGGLPGESPADYVEFAEALELCNGRLDPGFALKLIINCFIPQPFTALQFAPVDPVAPWRKPAWSDVCHGENRHRFKYKIKQMQSLPKPTRWAQALAVTRASADHWPLVAALALNPVARKLVADDRFDQFVRMADRAGMSEGWLFGEHDVSEELPWERVWKHPRATPESTRRQWKRYRELSCLLSPT